MADFPGIMLYHCFELEMLYLWQCTPMKQREWVRVTRHLSWEFPIGYVFWRGHSSSHACTPSSLTVHDVHQVITNISSSSIRLHHQLASTSSYPPAYMTANYSVCIQSRSNRLLFPQAHLQGEPYLHVSSHAQDVFGHATHMKTLAIGL